jgi:hypothetical protein
MALSLPSETTSTQKFFNSIDGIQYDVNPAVYDQVYNFFRGRTTSDLAAQELTQYLIIMTHNNQLNPLNLLPDLANNNVTDIKALIITFFNTIRDSYSKLGFTNVTNTNYWVDRNIIA